VAQQDSRKLVKTKEPGVYRRGEAYVVRWKHRGQSHKRHFRTFSEAREFKRGLHATNKQPMTRQTVADYFDAWIVSYRGRTVRGLDEETRTEYRRSFEHHILPRLGLQKLRDLGSRDISDWLGWLEQRGVHPPTILKAKRALSAMLATAAQDGDIQANPALGVRYVPAHEVRQSKPARRKLTADDELKIIAALPEHWQVFFSLLAETGVRISELLGLRWRNVYLGDDPYVYICEQFRKGKYKRLKTEASNARLPLSAPMAAWLARVRPDNVAPDSPVFATGAGTPLNYSNVYNRVLRPALRKTDIAVKVDGEWDYQGVAFHAFRRACGSLLVNAGMDLKQVQQRLRHAQLSTTLASYVEELDSGRGAADRMGDLLWGHPGATEHPQTATNDEASETVDSQAEREVTY
jgi:integrase